MDTEKPRHLPDLPSDLRIAGLLEDLVADLWVIANKRRTLATDPLPEHVTPDDLVQYKQDLADAQQDAAKAAVLLKEAVVLREGWYAYAD